MKFNPLPYIAIILLCLVCTVQAVHIIAADKRAEVWHSEALKLSHDWQEVDAKNREAIENYRNAFNTCLVKLQR